MEEIVEVNLPDHDIYAPSSTERWTTCTASAQASTRVPRRDTQYTIQGTNAHQYAEHALRTGTPPNSGDPELDAAIDMYVEECLVIKNNAGMIMREMIEARIRHMTIKDFGGTADYALLHQQRSSTILHVVDFKAGAGVPVEIVGNKQLLSYCSILGSYFPGLIDVFKMTIVQPRTQNHDDVQHWEVTAEAIQQHEQLVQQAICSEPVYVAGPHCQWCPVAAHCQTLADQMMEIATESFDPITTSPDLLTRWLGIHSMATAIRGALDAIQERIVQAAREGFELPGYKVVEVRSHRRWIPDEEDLINELADYNVPEDLVVTKKVKSPAQIEKVLKQVGFDNKTAVSITAPLVEQIVTGHRIVPESARGRAVSLTGADDFEPYTERELDQRQSVSINFI